MISLLLAASAALALDQDAYMPVRIDCDLVGVRDQDKSDKRKSRLTLLFPFEASKVGSGFKIYAVQTLDDGRTWLTSISASSVPYYQKRGTNEPTMLFAAQLDFGDGVTASILSSPRDTRRLTYNSVSVLTDGAGSVITRGTCRMTKEVDSV
jgi:hypothetical protein